MDTPSQSNGSFVLKRQLTVVYAFVPTAQLQEIKVFVEQFFAANGVKGGYFSAPDRELVTTGVWVGLPLTAGLHLFRPLFEDMATKFGAKLVDQRGIREE